MTDYDRQSNSDFGPFSRSSFTSDAGVGPTGVQGQFRGRSRIRTDERHLPYARHMGIEILTATTPDGLVSEFDDWKKADATERYRILDLRLDFTTSDNYILLVIYSQ